MSLYAEFPLTLEKIILMHSIVTCELELVSNVISVKV